MAERAAPGGQRAPRPGAAAGPDPAPAIDFEDAGAELVPEELDGRLGFEAALDAVESQRRDSLRKLCLRDARLHTERLNQYVSRRTDGFGHVVEPHVVESVKTPGFHG